MLRLASVRFPNSEINARGAEGPRDGRHPRSARCTRSGTNSVNAGFTVSRGGTNSVSAGSGGPRGCGRGGSGWQCRRRDRYVRCWASRRRPARRRSPGGGRSSANAPPRSCPAPTVSCRSRSEPHRPGSRWRAPARSRPARPCDQRVQVASCRPASPGRGRPPTRGRCRSTPRATVAVDRLEVALEVLHPGGEAAPAAGAGLHEQPGPAARRPTRRAAAGAPRAPGAAPSAGVRRSPPSRRGRPPPPRRVAARAQGRARAPAADWSTVAPVGEPRFTSSGAWMKTGTTALSASGGEGLVLGGVAVGPGPTPEGWRRRPAPRRRRPRPHRAVRYGPARRPPARALRSGRAASPALEGDGLSG